MESQTESVERRLRTTGLDSTYGDRLNTFIFLVTKYRPMDVLSVEDVEVDRSTDGVEKAMLVSGDRMNAMHVRMEPGASASEHSHPNEQIVYVYDGELVLVVDGEERTLTPGDSLLIPGGVMHYAENRSDEPAHIFDVFSPPRE